VSLLLVAALGYGLRDLGPAPGDAATTAFMLQPFSIAFLTDYWLHFELVSVLLVAVAVAAIAVIGSARGRRG
jgi:NADH:ubiquinone oxidoreductase subunit 6 (subunit J)